MLESQFSLTANGRQNHGAQYDADADDEYVIGEVLGALDFRAVVRPVQKRFDAGRQVGHNGGRVGGAVVVDKRVDVVTAAADGHRPDGPDVVGGGGGQRPQVIVGGPVAVVVHTAGVRGPAAATPYHAAARYAGAGYAVTASAIKRYCVGRHPQHAAPAPAAGSYQCPEQGHQLVLGFGPPAGSPFVTADLCKTKKKNNRSMTVI